MGLAPATKQASVTAVVALGAYISAHTGAGGGTTGANEGSSSRTQTTWGSAANPQTGSAVNVPCPAGTYTEFGVWSALTAGTFVGSTPFSGGSVVVSGTGASITITPTWQA